VNITEQPGESPNPPLFDYDTWGLDGDGKLHHSLYGHWWPRNLEIDQTFIELECYREGRTIEEGGLGKYGHLREAVDALWNREGKTAVEWNPWLEKMMEEACEHDYLGIAGASSTSKSFGGAILAWLNVLCSPHDSMSLVTSTSVSAAKKRIWKSVIQLHNALPLKYRKLYKHKPSLHMFHWQRDDGKIADDSCGISLIASEQKQEANAVAKLVGLKADRSCLLVADELCELSHSIVAAADNLVSIPEFRMVAMSNPKDREDPFGVFMEPADGWNTIDESCYEWKTKMGKAIRFDVMLSPNYIEREQIYRYMLTYQKVESAKERLGETSARFYRFFRGFFPIVGQEDVLYSETDFTAYLRDSIEWAAAPVKVAALDLAGSSGGDRNALTIGLFGADKEGVKCLQYEKTVFIKENAADKLTPFPEQVVREVKKILEVEGIDPRNFAVDSTAAKFAVAWMVKEIGTGILQVEFGGNASERPVSSSDRVPASKRYDRRVAELWGSGIEYLRGRQWAGLRKQNGIVIAELKARHYEMKKSGDGERMSVEPKREMKLRAMKSPDAADSWCILCELCRQRFHWMSAERGLAVMEDTSYDEMLRSLDVAALSSGGQPDWVPSAA
jgi:hypothetical protein